MDDIVDEFRYKQYLEQMNNCTYEWDHEDADAIIADFVEELGYIELADMYRACRKWFY